MRNSLHDLQPEHERRWRWQRRANLTSAGAIGAAAMGLVSVATWHASAAVERREAGMAVARWQS